MKQLSQQTYLMRPCFCVSCSNKNWKIYHSCYNTFPFYIALKLNCKVMLSHTLQTGCIIWQNASPNKALFSCVFTVFTLLISFLPWSILLLNHLDKESLQIRFQFQMMYLLLYFFARSYLKNTLVTMLDLFRSLNWVVKEHIDDKKDVIDV